MRPSRTIGCLLLAFLAWNGGPLSARADEAADAALERGLCSPAAAERQAAVRATLARGEAARPLGRAWTGAADPRLRAGGWRVLAAVGRPQDLVRALDGLRDAHPEVARHAARSVVRLGARLPAAEEPWIPAGGLDEAQVRALVPALVAEMERAPAGEIAPVLLRLGEGLVPCLVHVLQRRRFPRAAHQAALAALASIGGDRARQVLSDLIPALWELDEAQVWEAWWRALSEIGPGRGLDGAHQLVVAFAERALTGDRRFGHPPGLRWRSVAYFYRFVATCPPAEGADVVSAYLDACVEDGTRGRRLIPTLAPDLVKAHLVIAEPSDERLAMDVLAARSPPRNGWRRRQEELGQVLVHLEPYKARAGVRAGLDLLLQREDLARTVSAWARYLRGDLAPAQVRSTAAALIDADGAAATLAQRRLGARLMDRAGDVPAARIRATLEDLDGWIRALGLRWAVRAAAAGTFPPAERDAAVRAGLQDRDRGVFLLASELHAGAFEPAVRERLLEIAVRGPRSLRGRAWQVVDGALAEAASPGEEPFVAPRGHASLDERLRALARARRAWAQGGR